MKSTSRLLIMLSVNQDRSFSMMLFPNCVSSCIFLPADAFLRPSSLALGSCNTLLWKIFKIPLCLCGAATATAATLETPAETLWAPWWSLLPSKYCMTVWGKYKKRRIFRRWFVEETQTLSKLYHHLLLMNDRRVHKCADNKHVRGNFTGIISVSIHHGVMLLKAFHRLLLVDQLSTSYHLEIS